MTDTIQVNSCNAWKNVWEYNNGSVRPGKDFFGMSAARDVYWNVKQKYQPSNKSFGMEMQIDHSKNSLENIQVKYVMIITFRI